jgi:hypothetical protein
VRWQLSGWANGVGAMAAERLGERRGCDGS